ncbi:MAG TPA: patatin-like phospholipase family protein [Gemmatimonadales bacterium]|nr:patatin-like phospholipase family protein [Gemmatimonadales bacterium]
MQTPRLLRSSLERIGLTIPPRSAEEAPLPLCLILEEEYRRLHPEHPLELTWLLEPDHVLDLPRLASKLTTADDPAAAWLAGQLSTETTPLLRRSVRGEAVPRQQVLSALLKDLNWLLEKDSLGAHRAFASLRLPRITADLLARQPDGDARVHLNRLLLEAAFPDALARIHAVRLTAFYVATQQHSTTALCLSGGGIRSATFALGLLQALARHGVLQEFDYLSTVSGGGYIGSWLTGWIHRVGREAAIDALRRSVAGDAPDLPGKPRDPVEPEPVPIRQLRAYSNYLAPRLGLLSADTWTLLAIYLRNLFLNWLVILPLLAAVLLLPILAVTVVRAHVVVSLAPWRSVVPWAMAVGLALAVLAIRYVHAQWPSKQASRPPSARSPHPSDQRQFLRRCLLPLLGATALLTTVWAWLTTAGTSLVPPLAWNMAGVTLHSSAPLGFAAIGGLLHLSGWLLTPRRLVPLTLLQGVVVLMTGAIGGLVAYAAAAELFGEQWSEDAPAAEWYVCFAAPLFLALVLGAANVYTGLTSRWASDDDREWAARFGAWLLIAAVGWSVVSLLVIFGPPVLADLGPLARAMIGSLGGIAGLFTLLSGYSPKTPGTRGAVSATGVAARLVLPLAAPLFATVLIVLLSLVDKALVSWWAPSSDPSCHVSSPLDPAGTLQIVHCASSSGRILLLMAVLVAFGWVMGTFINTNRFSLHAMYRDRLIRAYLGASRAARHPDRFTGFDPDDNVFMNDLWPNTTAPTAPQEGMTVPQKPLHVVNIALNLVAGRNLAWQQRKAEPLTVTALHVGNHRLGYRRTRYPGTGTCYGGRRGISLGTAVTISGAAASPNMGYHSSPVIAFLMTLFNVRLGWWLGNPGVAGNTTFLLPFPRSAVRPIIEEAFGLTDDTNPYVYLSDGGHFDNLGLYEMVLRRCRLVLVSDASCDPNGTLDDLGNAIRKVRIDLGVPIEIRSPLPIYPRRENGTGKYHAFGTIRYSSVDGSPPERDGILVYVKPAWYGVEPPDVCNYARTSPAFPHETTADQFFSESQFESYRALGYYIASGIFGPGTGQTSTGTLEQRVQDLLQAPSGQAGAGR